MRASSVTGAAGDGGLAVEPSDMLTGGRVQGSGFSVVHSTVHAPSDDAVNGPFFGHRDTSGPTPPRHLVPGGRARLACHFGEEAEG
jgi:hypothetical protein